MASPRSAGWGQLEIQNCQWFSFNPSSKVWKPEKPMFHFTSKGQQTPDSRPKSNDALVWTQRQGKANIPVWRSSGRRNSLGREICFILSTNLNINLIQKHLTETYRIMFDQIFQHFEPRWTHTSTHHSRK